mmetsp:Transcript_133331/g.231307  ORF Transcript_133331/g.231307 Transcript_133331/m.231307 type:complete len:413 (+) Transcript_133331:1658-2896(+)
MRYCSNARQARARLRSNVLSTAPQFFFSWWRAILAVGSVTHFSGAGGGSFPSGIPGTRYETSGTACSASWLCAHITTSRRTRRFASSLGRLSDSCLTRPSTLLRQSARRASITCRAVILVSATDFDAASPSRWYLRISCRVFFPTQSSSPMVWSSPCMVRFPCLAQSLFQSLMHFCSWSAIHFLHCFRYWYPSICRSRASRYSTWPSIPMLSTIRICSWKSSWARCKRVSCSAMPLSIPWAAARASSSLSCSCTLRNTSACRSSPSSCSPLVIASISTKYCCCATSLVCMRWLDSWRKYSSSSSRLLTSACLRSSSACSRSRSLAHWSKAGCTDRRYAATASSTCCRGSARVPCSGNCSSHASSPSRYTAMRSFNCSCLVQRLRIRITCGDSSSSSKLRSTAVCSSRSCLTT